MRSLVRGSRELVYIYIPKHPTRVSTKRGRRHVENYRKKNQISISDYQVRQLKATDLSIPHNWPLTVNSALAALLHRPAAEPARGTHTGLRLSNLSLKRHPAMCCETKLKSYGAFILVVSILNIGSLWVGIPGICCGARIGNRMVEW